MFNKKATKTNNFKNLIKMSSSTFFLRNSQKLHFCPSLINKRRTSKFLKKENYKKGKFLNMPIRY